MPGADASGIRAGRAYVSIGSDESQLQKGLRRAEARLRTFAASVEKIGRQLAGVGTTIAAPFALSSVVFADYESAMARVSALTKASEADFARLGDKAKALGASTVFSAKQAAEAMGVFALAGYDVETILKAVGPTLDLAAAGQIEIAEAADIAAKIMAGMGISADNLGNTLDVLTKAMTTANTDISMLGEAFKFIGPIAKTAGTRLEEITGAIQILSNAGIQGEMAGTTLRAMILSLTTPSAEAKDTLDALGVSVADASGNVRPLVEIIGQLERAMAGMGSAEKLEALGTIFSDRAAGGAAVLVDRGAAGLAEATAALEDSAGTSADIASKQLDTLRGSALILLSALQGLAIEVGESVAPTLREWGEKVIGVANAVSILVKSNKEFLANVFKVGVAIGAAGVALIGLAVAAKVAALGIVGLKIALAVLTSPITLVVAALGVAGWAFLNFTDTGQAALGSLKATATAAMGGIANALKAGDIQLAGKILWLGLRVEFQKGVNFLNAIWQDWGTAAKTVISDFQFFLAAKMVDVGAAIKATWVQTIADLTGSWGSFVERIIKMIAPFASALAEILGFDVQKLIDGALGAVGVGPGAEGAARDREAATAGDLARIEADRLAARGSLSDQQAAADAARFAGARGSLAAGDAELARLQGDLAAAIAESVPKPIGEALDEAATDAGAPAGSPGRAGQGLTPEGLDEDLDRSEKKTDVKGSFSAAALRGLGAGDSAAERTAEASERTADAMEGLNDKARQGRLVFTE